MDKIIIQGSSNPLVGSVKIEGAKNAVLPLLAATILATTGKTTLTNVPVLSDVFTMNNVVRGLNTKVIFEQEENRITVDATQPLSEEAPYKYVSKMRASIVVLGPILARNGYAKVSMPGGCTIGSRPIDLHLKGLEAMGAEIKQTAGFIEAKANRLHGAHIYMDFPSVGATQNIMMAATLADGVTVIENAAREPEIVDLAVLLNKMGAKVRGAGTETLTITGVEELMGTSHSVVQDRIEAGTFMVAAAMTGGNVLVQDAIWEHNRPLIAKLLEMGVSVTEEDEGIRIQSDISKLRAVNVKTLPHPGFPTDMQAQFTVLMTVAKGESTMIETVFENRFQHLEEMRRMGLHSEIMRDTARIVGGQALQGAQVMSTDLRASAALILTGLVADGETKVGQLTHLDRGYYQFHKKLANLGANIKRVKEEDDE
ncbi:UDP-N-acetylglucosamine 1-carboxyvinyltransferase [Streptococcus constellatus subsp. pharyngis]|uniref:UDP-N-acetylglucosamine 1-carboxyvinyltransferase n=1 Tax=Streptococcus constellatus subsp. pharyngis SK1060 = CCUG 46377 TaxID=1035184 RepID=F9P5B3_STRCV|nr:UDP-N-acetylglucosamine 1-carboxyvinyltransferase [Streptococcus constellatus]EHG13873.1 UDP-N-acetylglucosamine 1-carboxyvinyltransferase 1 [Streptococcus intermedius F0395]AGU72502.1 UDP-N-acetylglucosamine 1-carboxyvinyltransferase [Streptococcus constellatus subsp. pharyngis C232]AGU74258.1 UDP-N-acetylglucosamine 1-carboxyvinyltransferase [Streptococcus constellatus subsp. pharyngis C818]AGU79626.1 UDP-N-acetylglucosamine 1-carboxyvinyltransferase [Streptococcus constellatus subsp. phar